MCGIVFTFYEPKRVLEILDKLENMDAATKVAMDPALMGVLSACILQERFSL